MKKSLILKCVLITVLLSFLSCKFQLGTGENGSKTNTESSTESENQSETDNQTENQTQESDNSDDTASEVITYTVNHRLQNLNDDDYTISDTEKIEGVAGEQTAAAAKAISGFTVQSFSQKEIASDSSTTIDIYYNRKSITITFDYQNGTDNESFTAKFGSSINAPSNPAKTEYLFMGWQPELPETFPAENTTYTAQWDTIGNVDKCSFSLTIPQNTKSIEIYRKKYNETEWKKAIFLSVWTDYSFPETMTFDDPFVNAGTTYNYKCLFIDDINTIDFNNAFYLENSGSLNFTPATGSGEVSFESPFPNFSYNSQTKCINFEQPLKIKPESQEQDYSPALYAVSYSTIDSYELNSLNFLETFLYTRGLKNITELAPCIFKSYDMSTQIWYIGTSKDLSSKNISVQFTPETLELKNIEKGIELTLTKSNTDSPWSGHNTSSIYIDIYEDEQLLNCKYWLNTTFYATPPNYSEPTEYSQATFIFPFVKAGKTYTFKFYEYQNVEISKSIVATANSAVQLDSAKMAQNVTNLSYTYTENDNAQNYSRILKTNGNPKDIFTCDDIDEYYDTNFLIGLNNPNASRTFKPSIGGYSNLHNEGLELTDILSYNAIYYFTYGNIMDWLNYYQQFTVTSYFEFFTDELGSTENGYLYFQYPVSQEYTWTTIQN